MEGIPLDPQTTESLGQETGTDVLYMSGAGGDMPTHSAWPGAGVRFG